LQIAKKLLKIELKVEQIVETTGLDFKAIQKLSEPE